MEKKRRRRERKQNNFFFFRNSLKKIRKKKMMTMMKKNEEVKDEKKRTERRIEWRKRINRKNLYVHILKFLSFSLLRLCLIINSAVLCSRKKKYLYGLLLLLLLVLPLSVYFMQKKHSASSAFFPRSRAIFIVELPRILFIRYVCIYPLTSEARLIVKRNLIF